MQNLDVTCDDQSEEGLDLLSFSSRVLNETCSGDDIEHISDMLNSKLKFYIETNNIINNNNIQSVLPHEWVYYYQCQFLAINALSRAQFSISIYFLVFA